jgi:site-specific DNA-cytosine methylase
VLSFHITQDPITEEKITPCLSAGNPHHGQASLGVVYENSPHYIVRRLTPTECARLQGFADRWGHVVQKDKLAEEEYRFWLEVRNTHASINGKQEQNYTTKQMLAWYNKLHNDSSEYKMWGNGIALPPALYCMQGIADALNAEEDDAWMQ